MGSGRAAADLLRRDVANSTDQHGGLRNRGLCVLRVDRRLEGLGKAEIEDLHAIPGHHHVIRFQIAMDESDVMGGGKAVSDLGSEVHHLPRRKRAVSDSLAQRYGVVRDRNATT